MKITIGGFDGVHIAHQYLINKADKVIIIEKGSSLTPGFDRLEYIKKPFDFLKLEKIKNLTAEDFLKYLKKLKAKEIIVGEDFRFGKDRKGDINLLKNHFNVEVIKEIKIKDIPVHAKIIRNLIRKSQIKTANKLLGHNYKIKGLQIKGQGLGNKELVPTINLEIFKPYILPQGVFLTLTNNSPSLTFIGKRSTDNNFSVETHLLDFKPIKGMIIVEFLDFIRENKKFSSLQELKKQILNDIDLAKEKLNSFYKSAHKN
jgi:riboflavin kinase/FMN adenylyltransferase